VKPTFLWYTHTIQFYKFKTHITKMTKDITIPKRQSMKSRVKLSLPLCADRLCAPAVRVPGYRSRDPGYDSRGYQIFSAVVGLERDLLSLVRINEELFESKSSGSGYRKPRLTDVRIRCADHTSPSTPKMLALTSLTCGGRSIGIVRLRTKATELIF
jgi:hypothetical protein